MDNPSHEPDEEVQAQFVQAFEQAADPAAVLADFCARFRSQEGEFRALAATHRLLDQARPAQDQALPRRLGEFTLLHLIGRGGMGEVYEAHHAQLERKVAVKIIRQGSIAPQARDRFLNEQQILAQLHQTHIVPIYTAGEEGALQYFAMPYIHGAALHHVVRMAYRQGTTGEGGSTPTLGELAGEVARASDEQAARELAGEVARASDRQAARENLLTQPFAAVLGGTWDGEVRPPVPEPPWASAGTTPLPAVPLDARLTLSPDYLRSVAEALADTAEAIDHAHKLGILHRDLKPSNIMVDDTGQCWIIDFGLAAWVRGQAGAAPGGETALRAGPAVVSHAVGTPQYMAPEQYAGQADVRTDVWGLGVTLYEMLTLRPAFQHATPAALRAQIENDEPPPLGERMTNVPADLVAICRLALRKKPGQRYPTAAAFAADLRRWLRWEPTVARPARTPRRVALWARRHKGWASFLVLLGFLTLTLIGYQVQTSRAAQAETMAAEIEKEAANDRAEAANERAEFANERLRVSLVQRLQRLRFNLRDNGWSEDAWALARDIRKLRASDDLRNEAAAILAGLDARTSQLFDFGASSVAFDRTGKRLLLGGLRDHLGKPQAGAKLWESGSDRTVTANLAGDGPVAFGADGALLQLVAQDRWTLVLWDVGKQQLVRRFRLADQAPAEPWTFLTAPVLALASDGSLLAAATTLPDDKAVITVWESNSERPLRRYGKKATTLAFSPDGNLLAGGDEEGEITLWSVRQAEPVATFRRDRLQIHSLAFGRDPRPGMVGRSAGGGWMLASGDQGGSVTVWDLARRTVRTLCHGSYFDVYAVAFSPDGTLLASGGRSSTRLWDVATGRLLLNLLGQDFTTALAFSPDGRQLAVSCVTGFNPGKVVICDLEDGRGLRLLRGLVSQVEQVWYSADGRYLAALGVNWQLGIWDAQAGRLLHLLEVPKGMLADNAALAFSPDGKEFAFASSRATEGFAGLWDVATGQERRTWKLPPSLQPQLLFRPGGRLLHYQMETQAGKLAPVGEVPWKDHPRVCRIRDLLGAEPLKPIATITDFQRHVFHTRTSAVGGGYWVIDGPGGPKGEDRTLGIYEAATGKRMWSFNLKVPFNNGGTHVLDPEGKLLAFRPDTKGPYELVEVPTGKLVAQFPESPIGLGPEASYWTGAAPQGLYGYSLYRRGIVKPLVVLGIDTPPSSVIQEFNAAGTQLAWGNVDGTVTVADLNEVRRRLAAEELGW